jgi:outer membrane protein assembly factor BamB
MYCHDVRHTGRSPYSTVDTWDELWKFKQHKNFYVDGSPVISNEGTIYFGGLCDFYALYPNSTLKWKYDDIGGYVWSAPAIDENGIIYIGTVNDFSDGNHLYAFYPNDTLKWKFFTGDVIFSSPAIGDDGTIYFGHGGNPSAGYINAVYPNGTLKWRFQTNHAVYSSPAIGADGTIYCGSHDTYLYALYPNNGTLRWKYKTGHWIRTSPCIADDGTIYVVSLDDYLHAVNPNGTRKWRTDVGAGTSPTIGQDGTIYAGYGTLHAINPSNGSIKWKFGVSGNIKGSTPCHSLEDTIYFGTDSGWLYAVNSDGTLKWQKKIANVHVDSAPAIAEDGTIYVGSAWDEGGYSKGYLHAFGWCELEADANGPYYGRINESIQFQGSAKGGYRPHSFHWDFGDGNNSYEEDPTHIYSEPGNYTVVFTVTDNTSNTSSDTSWALIREANNNPDKPDIDGPVSWPVKVEVCFTFHSTDPDGDDVKYLIDWGDDNINETEYYPSCTPVEVCHTWEDMVKYTLQAKAVDIWGAESDWNVFVITIPRNRMVSNLWYQWFLERFPLLARLLNLLIV